MNVCESKLCSAVQSYESTYRGGNSSLVFHNLLGQSLICQSLADGIKEGRKDQNYLSICVLFILFTCSDEYCDSSWTCPLAVALDQGFHLCVCVLLYLGEAPQQLHTDKEI